MDQYRRSLMQQQQLLTSSLGASNQLPLQLLTQPQSSLSLDPLLQAWQAALQLQQNSRGLPPPPINAPLSANAAAAAAAAAAQSNRQEEESKDEEQSGSEEKQA